MGNAFLRDNVCQDALECDQIDFQLLSATDESSALSVLCHTTHKETPTEAASSPNVLTISNTDLPLSVPAAGAGSCTSDNLQQVINSPASSLHSDRSDQSSDLVKSQSLTLSGGITSEELATGDQVGVIKFLTVKAIIKLDYEFYARV
jgi:hypothetical protein